jgi:hypothetical protein
MFARSRLRRKHGGKIGHVSNSAAPVNITRAYFDGPYPFGTETAQLFNQMIRDVRTQHLTRLCQNKKMDEDGLSDGCKGLVQ